ncbi:spermatogenesis-associated protein 7-like isoform X2 [Physella acuta]|uniref:spermatogenesis-associated protein 7-like isoform X2 n=1 Tax=Physella acuta TaxID=109671 RepID=UPI0027DE920C|nr:spermatogenesis-associated protein 7-like isoform X2 [Physella acuta]
MAESLRGNLGLKSSPLAPTACKLSTQYLVLDHMTNHYNKISKAKSAIDSKPPKCLMTSQKMRDRRNRELLINSPRPRQTLARSQSDLQKYQELFNDEPEDDDERLVQSIVRSTLMEKKGSNNATYGSLSLLESHDMDNSAMHKQAGDTRYSARPSRPTSARSALSLQSARSGHSLTSVTSRVPITTSRDPSKITYQGDLLDKRPHLFTEPKGDFTPRTLKVNHESKLKNSKWYNPPRKSASNKQNNSDEAKENGGRRSQPRSRKSLASQDGHFSNEDIGEGAETAQFSESMLMDITVRSRDGRQTQGDNQVPPLAISMDQDHMNWLQEQASKAQVRLGKLRSTLHQDEELQGHSGSRRQSEINEAIRMETLKRDEEQKYLSFANEVAEDVRSRGICADSVLHKVFDNHIERRKHELDEGRMRKVIEDIKKDLGLRERSAERPKNPPVSRDRSLERRNKSPVSSGRSAEKRIKSPVPSDRRNKSPVSSERSAEKRSKSPASSYRSDHNKSPILSSKKSVRKEAVDYDHTASTSPRSETASYPTMHEDMSTLEPLNGTTMNTTLQSTSTIKFGETKDVYSTINSERGFEDLDDNGLTATQALEQYQLDLTAKDEHTSYSRRSSEAGLSEHSQASHVSRQARPATGERRDPSLDEDSEPRARPSNETLSRTRRREWLKKSREEHVSSSSTSQAEIDKDSQREMIRDRSLDEDAANEDLSSARSVSSSQKPVAKPRGSRSASQQSSVKQDSIQDAKLEDTRQHVAESHKEEKHVNKEEASDVEEVEEEYDDDYEEEEEESTHRTSDDDF